MTGMTSGDDQPISVADNQLGRTRVLSEQCDTCVFRPGNRMHLPPGRLSEMVREALARERFIICHDTLPHGDYPDYGPAVCRGFADRYDTQALQLARRLWGIVEVAPPSATAAVTPADAYAEVDEHDCQAAGTLEYVAHYGAPGIGQAWRCTDCGRAWARLGNHFYPADDGAHILSPDATR